MSANSAPSFLGEQAIDVASHPVFGSFDRTAWALLLAQENADVEGAAHKAWVLDQVVRVLHGTPVAVRLASWSDGREEHRFCLGVPSASYQQWRQALAENGNVNYDEGIPP